MAANIKMRFVCRRRNSPYLEVGKTYLLYLNDDYIHDGETLYTVVGGYQGVAVDTDGEWTALSEANGLWPSGPAASEG